MGACPYENRVKGIVYLFYGDVFTDPRIVFYLDAHLFYDRDFPRKVFFREPVGRDTHIEHAAEPIVGLEDRYPVAGFAKF